MKAAVLVVAFLAASACARSPARKAADIEADATAAIRRGELVPAQLLAEQALADGSFSPDSTWPWAFRLLRAESLILQLKAKDARPDLIGPMPPASAFDSLRARQKYLQARAEVTEGHLQSALAIVDDGLEL